MDICDIWIKREEFMLEAKKAGACIEQYLKAKRAKTRKGFLGIVAHNMFWLTGEGVITIPKAKANKLFKEFLEDKKCSAVFKANKKRESKFWRDQIGSDIPKGFEQIDWAFHWSETKQGENYWRKINANWLYYLVNNLVKE